MGGLYAPHSSPSLYSTLLPRELYSSEYWRWASAYISERDTSSFVAKVSRIGTPDGIGRVTFPSSIPWLFLPMHRFRLVRRTQTTERTTLMRWPENIRNLTVREGGGRLSRAGLEAAVSLNGGACRRA